MYKLDIPAVSPTMRVMARWVSEITFTVKRSKSKPPETTFPALSHLNPTAPVSVHYSTSSASTNEAVKHSAIVLEIAVRSIIISPLSI